ncbi:MAG: peroxiredoxin-like family protein [Zetaproteobacteria bacterium]|nr:peroxiredoxin-like family protein [Zetaproteobacteria bacterium]
MKELQPQLDALKAKFKASLPAEKLAAMEEANQALLDSLSTTNAIAVGDQLPPFALPNQYGETITSQALLQGKHLVVSFFRGVWCPYCNLEVKALEAYVEQFRAANAEIVVISPQVQAWAQKSVQDNRLSFDVLSDLGNHYAAQLGIRFVQTPAIQKIYQDFKLTLPRYNGDESWSLPMPTRLVVHSSGRVVYADIHPDYTHRPEPAETLRILQQIERDAVA